VRRLVHLSDLHFGRTHPELLTPLIEAVNGATPDLVAITGDLTQRARRAQFREARAFLDRIEAPWRAVPGNHDVPLDNPILRVLRPFGRYRRYICRDLTPDFAIDGLVVQGLNTVDPFRWQRGRARRRQIAEACAMLSGTDAARVILAHHPFEQDPEDEKALMKHAGKELEALAGCGATLVLSGHLHRWRAEPFVARKSDGRVLQVHVGTGLSTRLRGEENDFAILDIDRDEIGLRRMVAREGAFRQDSATTFRLGPGGWTAEAKVGGIRRRRRP